MVIRTILFINFPRFLTSQVFYSLPGHFEVWLRTAYGPYPELSQGSPSEVPERLLYLTTFNERLTVIF